MDIKQAKMQLDNAVRAYLSRDEKGRYRIPQRMQRPIIMFGPPGVGKTAIAAQVAEERGINFVSYSITHHTRQSALGLPFITTEEFDGNEQRISDYTMSEIIASVHRSIKQSGCLEGILFLDEVNCASETLAPAMLQFLQFKTFGMHVLPQGWVIVCAGNPPEYNRSAREFDPATLDRVKRINVQPDVSVWLEYATTHGVHPAITTYLEAKPNAFYMVQADVNGARLVTARGWEDLSRIIQAYEDEDIAVDVDLVSQYIQEDQTAREFFAYYDLFCKYRDDYKVSHILRGQASNELIERASAAPFSERVALVGLLIDSILSGVHDIYIRDEAFDVVRSNLLDACNAQDESVASVIERRLATANASLARLAGTTERRELVVQERAFLLQHIASALAGAESSVGVMEDVAKEAFNSLVDSHQASTREAMNAIDHAFEFLDAAFGEKSEEALMMIAKLSADPELVRAVAAYGSEQYVQHNKDLLLDERKVDLLRQIDSLDKESEGE